jgi:hypothetical protein
MAERSARRREIGMERRLAMGVALLGVAAASAQGVRISGPKYVPAKLATVEAAPIRTPTPAVVNEPLFWQIGPAIDVNRPPSNVSQVGPPNVKSAPAPIPKKVDPPKPKPAEEALADPVKPGVGGQVWSEFDITDYTARFSPADKPEDGVKHWLLKATGDVWSNVELACLSVSAERVKIYHNPDVQRKAAATLGRFLHFAPGMFRCRVRILSTRDGDWRNSFAQYLEPLPVAEAGRGAWRIPSNVVEPFARGVAAGVGDALLVDQRFGAPNGQLTVMEATEPKDVAPTNGRTAAPTRVDDGLVVRLRPLIADGAAVDLDVQIVGKRVVEPSAIEGGRDATTEPLEILVQSVDTLQRIGRDQALIVSLGRGPNYDRRPGLLKARRPETLAIIEVNPERGNTLAGGMLPPPIIGNPAKESARTTNNVARPRNLTKRELDDKRILELTAGPRN